MSEKENLIRIPIIILFWAVMAMGIGTSIWLIRILLIIQIEGVHIVNEPNPLILSTEIIFFTIGTIISVIIMIKISKILLEKMM